MNMAERAEQIDYEPDVLKFKQIWDEMKETNKDAQDKAKNKEAQTFQASSSSKQKKKIESGNKGQRKKSKKETIMSEKNIVRNPKASH